MPIITQPTSHIPPPRRGIVTAFIRFVATTIRISNTSTIFHTIACICRSISLSLLSLSDQIASDRADLEGHHRFFITNPRFANAPRRAVPRFRVPLSGNPEPESRALMWDLIHHMRCLLRQLVHYRCQIYELVERMNAVVEGGYEMVRWPRNRKWLRKKVRRLVWLYRWDLVELRALGTRYEMLGVPGQWYCEGLEIDAQRVSIKAVRPPV